MEFKPGDKVLIPAVVDEDGDFEFGSTRVVHQSWGTGAISDTRHLPNEVTEAMAEAGRKLLFDAFAANSSFGDDAGSVYLAMERARLAPPEPLKVGDRVREHGGPHVGSILAIYGADAWVGFEEPFGKLTIRLSALRLGEG